MSLPRKKSWLVIGAVIISTCAGLAYFTADIAGSNVEAPPSDEQLISALETKRGVFDELRALYLNGIGANVSANSPGYSSLMQAAGVQWIAWNAWFDPAMQDYRSGPKRELQPLRFRMASWRYRDDRRGLDGWNYKTKSLVFFPISPDGSGEILTWTAYPAAKLSLHRLVVQTDRPPADWKEHECLFRRVDAHWFVELCNDQIGG